MEAAAPLLPSSTAYGWWYMGVTDLQSSETGVSQLCVSAVTQHTHL